MGQFSAHAGKSELLRWLTGLPAPPKQTYLTHGEPAAAQALQADDPGEVSVEGRGGPLPGYRRDWRLAHSAPDTLNSRPLNCPKNVLPPLKNV